MTGADTFWREAQALRPQLVAWRRDLHMHPELAFEERRTAAIVAEELARLGLEVQAGVGRTGVVALLEGQHEGPTLLYRADMDALPIQEESEASYASRAPGVMHACGHDGHVSIGLGVARLLAARRETLAGRVKFVFQPGEEGAGGARAMIADGVLESPMPDLALGLHLWNLMEVGNLGMAPGAIMAGGSTFQLEIHGHGGHAAMPHLTADALLCATELVPALYSLAGRRLNALEGPAVLSVTSVRSSSEAYNVVPERVTLRGTCRTFSEEASARLETLLREAAEEHCRVHGCRVTLELQRITIPVRNDPQLLQRARRAFVPLAEQIPAIHEDDSARTMGSEDFSWLQENCPGMYLFLGSGNVRKGLNYGHHHPRFDFDEDALPLGVALMAAAIADWLLVDGNWTEPAR